MPADSCLFFCFHKVLALTPLPLENSNFFLLFRRRSREDAASCFYISSACRSVCRTYFQPLWKLSEVLRLKLNLIHFGFLTLIKMQKYNFWTKVTALALKNYMWNDEIALKNQSGRLLKNLTKYSIFYKHTFSWHSSNSYMNFIRFSTRCHEIFVL